ncbi:IS607 family transposase, partial [Aquibacillus sediminis]|uniref:IS607 family transposase n=1 Tax=Aquibacillus sediminis TaxID=2574734 RepID=UPI0011086560
KIAIYARVSTKKQADAGNLSRQKARLTEYAVHHQYQITGIYDDIASGLNENRKGLTKLFNAIKEENISYLIIEYKDRLARFGYRYLENHLNELGCKIIIIDEKEGNEEQELVDDLIAITTSFSARIYGKRGGKRVSQEIEKTLKRGVNNENGSNDQASS